MCMGSVPTVMPVFYIHVWCPEARVGVGSPGTVVIDGCKLPYFCWELNLRPLEVERVLLTGDYLSSPSLYFLF